MLIYAVADIHGRGDRLELIRRRVEETRPDVLVVAGDISNYRGARRVVGELSRTSAPVLAVRGNTDPPRLEHFLERFPNTTSLHGKRVTVKGVDFTGVSGTIPVPFRSRLRIRERRAREMIEPLVTRDSVLVAHPPPWGTLDLVLGRFHAGCRALGEIIAIREPVLFICGHIHEAGGKALLGRTVVVNCSMGRNAAGAVIEIEKNLPPKVEILSPIGYKN